MVISKWVRSLYTLLVVAVLLFLPAATRPAAAGIPGPCLPPAPCGTPVPVHVFDLSATVPVANLTVFPPGPCFESIHLNGSFEIRAHIHFPHNPGMPVATLHLNAEGITGTGLTTGARYQGGQGNTAVFKFQTPTASFGFNSAFELRPSTPNLFPPGPCRVPLAFSTTLTQTDSGPGLVVSLTPPSPLP